jgi:hypothetical protein
MRVTRALIAAAIAWAANQLPLAAAEFTFNDKVNQDVAKKLGIPVYFAVPASARAPLPQSFDTTDRLIEFKHPDAEGNAADVGLRLIVAKRAGFAKRMAKSGLLQTGDILLTFRPEWGGAGTYPNIQMGISHTGLAFVKDGAVYQLDNPMDAEYLGSQLKGDFTGEHYRTIKFIHVIRPRGLTDADRANIVTWATKFTSAARRIYPKQIAFNPDYNAPKYSPGKPLQFVKDVAQSALGQAGAAPTNMYCSEFVWSVLALRKCDPAATAASFDGKGGVPACVTPAMTPMKATGNYVSQRSSSSRAGLADGPLLVIDALKLPKDQRNALLEDVFVEHPAKQANMSSGHLEIAKTLQPKFAPLEKYYRAVAEGGFQRIQAYFIGHAFRSAMPDNYSPTGFLINTLLPSNNSTRTMDYVATIMFE